MSGGSAAAKSSSPQDDMELLVEPVQTSLTEIRKKIRNLEKKKTKLDALREEVKKSGKPLNEDQALALSRYEDNTQQLETCRELCKNFETCAVDIQKCYKKLAKKSDLGETTHLFDLEKYRAVVRALDSEDIVKRYVQQDDTSTDSLRVHVKVLRKILLPLRSDFRATDTLKSFYDYLKLVTDQQANLTNGRPVQLLEDTVPDAKPLLDRVVSSQFFTDHPEVLFVKVIPNVGAGPHHQENRVSSSGGRSTAGSLATVQPNSSLTNQPKGVSRDHPIPGEFSGSGPSSQGFHYAAGESPVQSMSFTNSKLNTSGQPSVAQPTPSVTSQVNYGGSASPALPPVNNFQLPPGIPIHGAGSGHPVGIPSLSRSTPNPSFPAPSPIKEVRPVVIPAASSPIAADVTRRQSESDQVSQNQAAWQSGRPFGTFDARKTHGENSSISPDAFSSQENRLDTDYDGNRGQNGANNGPYSNNNNSGPNFRTRGNGRPYEHQPDRRSFDGGRGGARRSEEGRGDSDGNRGGASGLPGDRGIQQQQRGGGRGARFMADNRGPRGNGQDFDGGRDGGRDDGDQQPQQPQQKPLASNSGPGNDADFGVFHVDNPSFKGRTGNYGVMSDDRRGNGGIRRGGPRGGPQLGGGPRGNYGGGGNNGRFGEGGVSNGGSYEN